MGFAFFDWIFLGLHMSFKVDIGILRMWIFSSMHFDSNIHILIRSCGKIMRKFMRWGGDRGTHNTRVMDGMWGYVPLLTLIRSEKSGIFRMKDRGMDLGDGRLSRIRWRIIFWDRMPQNGFGMRIGDGRFWDVQTQNGFRGRRRDVVGCPRLQEWRRGDGVEFLDGVMGG